MKTFSSLILLAFILVHAQYSAANQETPKPSECKKLIATGNPEYPPYLFKDSYNPKKLVGANAEILQIIAKSLNIEIDIVYSGPWSRAQQEVREGRIDLLAGAFFTVPRAQYMDYIHPAFLTTKSRVWINKKAPIKYNMRDGLINLKGITVINNSFGQEFDTFAKANLSIETVPTLKQAFRMLNLGRVDYLLYEESPAKAYASSLRIEDQIEITGPEISSEGLFITLSHRSECNTPTLRGKLVKALHDLLSRQDEQIALNNGLLKWRNQPGNLSTLN